MKWNKLSDRTRGGFPTKGTVARRLLCGLASVFAGCSVPFVEPDTHDIAPCPTLVAHRAGAREAGLPDNSLSALEAANADSLDILEVDVRWSSDGKAFLFHDKRLARGPWLVPKELVGQDISRVSSAVLERVCTPEDPKSCLPSLEELFDLMERSQGKVQLDVKGMPTRGQFEGLLIEIEQRRLTDRVILFCDPLSECNDVRAKGASIRLMVRIHDKGDFEQLVQAPPWAVQVDEEMLDSSQLHRLRAERVFVMVKTLDTLGDNSQHWEALQRHGVDLILTDFPRAARRVLCER